MFGNLAAILFEVADSYRQNLEFQYRDGGIWPFVAGFSVMALLRAGKRRKA